MPVAADKSPSRAFVEALVEVFASLPPPVAAIELEGSANSLCQFIDERAEKLRLKISKRQAYRWITGDSIPPRGRVQEILNALIKAKASADQLAAIEQIYDRWVRERQSAPGPAWALAERRVRGYLQRFFDDSHAARRDRAVVPVTAFVRTWRADGVIRRTPDAPREVVGLLFDPGSAPLRICVNGPRHTGRNFLCKVAAYELALSHVPNGRSCPLPLLVPWHAWADQIQLELKKEDSAEANARALFAVAGLKLDDDENPLDLLQSSRLAVVVTGFETREGEKEKRDRMLAVLARAARLVVAAEDPAEVWLDKEGSSGFGYTVWIQLLLPPDVLALARECRKRLGDADPNLPFLGTLGNTLESLASPRVSGRAFALIDRGDLSAASLLSPTVFLAGLYVDSMLRSNPRLVVAPSAADPDTSKDATLRLFPRINLEATQTVSTLSLAAQSHADPALRDKLDVVKRDGDWVDPGFEGARLFVLAYLNRHFDGMDPTEVLKQVDGEAMRLLAYRCPLKKLSELKWESTVTGPLALLKGGRRDSGDLWAKLEPRWPSFCSALGLLGGLCKREDSEKLRKLKNDALEALRAQWSVDAPSDPGKGNLRYYGARAAACLLSEDDVIQALGDELEAGDLAFYAEVALRLGARLWGRKDGKLNAVVPDELQVGHATTRAEELARAFANILSKRKIDSRELRHARYHAMATLVRLSPPLALRHHLREILGDLPIEANVERLAERAIESATAIGALWSLGADVHRSPSALATRLRDAAIREIAENWTGGAPNFIAAHMYLAFEALAPLLGHIQRSDNLMSVPLLVGKPEDVVAESGAIRYFLYYVRNELAAGIPLPDTILKQLEELQDALEKAIKERTQPTLPDQSLDIRPPQLRSPDVQNHADMAMILAAAPRAEQEAEE